MPCRPSEMVVKANLNLGDGVLDVLLAIGQNSSSQEIQLIPHTSGT